jgi:hypothetical protein
MTTVHPSGSVTDTTAFDTVLPVPPDPAGEVIGVGEVIGLTTVVGVAAVVGVGVEELVGVLAVVGGAGGAVEGTSEGVVVVTKEAALL